MTDWGDYLKMFWNFHKATQEDDQHTENHLECNGCDKTMAIFLLVGGKEVEMLLDHTRKVLNTVARHKLMRSLN